jgi:hypothetical protein
MEKNNEKNREVFLCYISRVTNEMELQFFNLKHFEKKKIHYRKDCRVTKRNEFLKLVLINFALIK